MCLSFLYPFCGGEEDPPKGRHQQLSLPRNHKNPPDKSTSDDKAEGTRLLQKPKSEDKSNGEISPKRAEGTSLPEKLKSEDKSNGEITPNSPSGVQGLAETKDTVKHDLLPKSDASSTASKVTDTGKMRPPKVTQKREVPQAGDLQEKGEEKTTESNYFEKGDHYEERAREEKGRS